MKGDWWSNVGEVLKRHLSLAEDDVFFAVREFERGAYLTSDGFRDKTNDLKGLDALETALRKAAPLLEEVSSGSSFSLMTHFHSGEYTEEERKRLGGTIYALTYERNKLLKGIEAARQALNDPDPLTRRSLKALNIEAVQVTDAAVEVWSQYHHRPPPRKALNPASRFGTFLIDLFEVCGLEADPKAAFRAWAQTYGAAV